MTVTFLPEKTELKTNGRTFFRDGKLHLTWVGTGFSFNVKGADRVMLSIDKFTEGVERYLKITADNREQVHAVSTGTENIVVLLGEGETHHLEIVRITEGATDIVISGITLYGDAPEMLCAPKSVRKKIEFIGDSLTAGYGNLGDASTPVYHSYEQDCTKAFSGITARMLDLEYSLVTVSGKGISHNWDGSTDFMIPEFYQYISRETKEPWDFRSWVPDIIVINAGSNDAASKTPGDVVAAAAKDFLKFVRAHNPDAQIVYAYGIDDKGLAEPLSRTVDELAATDDKICFFKFGDVFCKPDEKGANSHPNVKSHKQSAKQLCEFLISKGIVK